MPTNHISNHSISSKDLFLSSFLFFLFWDKSDCSVINLHFLDLKCSFFP
jgi:hypothetical protein